MVSPAQKMWICTVREAKKINLQIFPEYYRWGGGKKGRTNPDSTYSVRYNLIRYFLISQFVLLTSHDSVQSIFCFLLLKSSENSLVVSVISETLRKGDLSVSSHSEFLGTKLVNKCHFTEGTGRCKRTSILWFRCSLIWKKNGMDGVCRGFFVFFLSALEWSKTFHCSECSSKAHCYVIQTALSLKLV